MEETNSSSVNFTVLETNYTTESFDLITRMCVSSFNFLVGLPTHSYVMWLIISAKERGVSSEFFNLNLSICEIGICMKSLFVVLSICFSHFKDLPKILDGLTVTGRPLFQCLICVERYLAVVHPVTFLKYKPLRYRAICGAAAWMVTLGSCLSCVLFFTLFTTSLTIYTWFFLLQYIFFFLIQLFCLVAVLRALNQSGPGERKREKEENRMKRRAFYIILIITLSMAIIYVPFTISGFFAIFTQQHSSHLWFVSVFCYVMGGFVQPVIFLGRVGKLPLFSIKPGKVSRAPG